MWSKHKTVYLARLFLLPPLPSLLFPPSSPSSPLPPSPFLLPLLHTNLPSSLYPQGYLKEFNELIEELREKKVGIFGICAEAQQDLADQAVKDWGLHYQVRIDLSRVITLETDSGWTFSYYTSGRNTTLNGALYSGAVSELTDSEMCRKVNRRICFSEL